MKANTYYPTKTNQSQTKPTTTAKPIYMYESGGTTLSLIPRFYGKIAIAIEKNGKKYSSKLQAAVSPETFLNSDETQETSGNVHSMGSDVFPPEKAYQKLGSAYGFIRVVSCMTLLDSSEKLTIECTHCERGDNGKLRQSNDGYCKELEITLPREEYVNFLEVLHYYTMSQENLSQAHNNAASQQHVEPPRYTRYNPNEDTYPQHYNDAANGNHKSTKKPYQQRYTPQTSRRAGYAQGGDWQ